MKKVTILIITLILISNFNAKAQADTSSTKVKPPIADFNGIWKNGVGSEMHLEVGTDGSITGIYKTGVGKPEPAEEFNLTGFAANDIIGFTVNYGKYGSITSWVGQHTVDVEGKAIIKTLWHLTKDIEDDKEAEDLWSSVLAGSSTFTK